MELYNIHPDFMKYKGFKPPMNAVILPIVNFALQRVANRKNQPVGLIKDTYRIHGYMNGMIRLDIFQPRDMNDDSPCLVYFHGGAFVMKAAPHHIWLAQKYALETSCKVVFVDYRLLPRHPFPVGIEDAFSAYDWVLQNTGMLGIDPSRIAVGGDSAGGAIVAAVCLMARDRKVSMPCFQMLIYPATDIRQNTESMKEFTDTPLWNSKLNAKLWKKYLRNGSGEKPEYASPALAENLKGMPPAYVEVAEYDCLRDEGVAFAEALEKDGVSVELFESKQTVHGFEVVQQNDIVAECVKRRIATLKAHL